MQLDRHYPVHVYMYMYMFIVCTYNCNTSAPYEYDDRTVLFQVCEHAQCTRIDNYMYMYMSLSTLHPACQALSQYMTHFGVFRL